MAQAHPAAPRVARTLRDVLPPLCDVRGEHPRCSRRVSLTLSRVCGMVAGCIDDGHWVHRRCSAEHSEWSVGAFVMVTDLNRRKARRLL